MEELASTPPRRSAAAEHELARRFLAGCRRAAAVSSSARRLGHGFADHVRELSSASRRRGARRLPQAIRSGAFVVARLLRLELGEQHRQIVDSRVGDDPFGDCPGERTEPRALEHRRQIELDVERVVHAGEHLDARAGNVRRDRRSRRSRRRGRLRVALPRFRRALPRRACSAQRSRRGGRGVARRASGARPC